MQELLGNLKRSHMCGNINLSHEGQQVVIMGWVNKRRDLGQLVFITVRDRSGVVQAVADENKKPELFKKAQSLRGEFVVAITGVVRARTAENVNKQMATGEIEIEAEEIRLLSEAETPPFSTMDEGVKEDLRLKYRYLDLRRPQLQRNLMLRHQIGTALREYLNRNNFVEIETPYLTKSSPEGARDYLVPSRVHPGEFYALPQSPQIFKQLLMVSGFDRYYQIVRCFRDEDLRADRQPEFTQLDIETSFMSQDDIMAFNEGLISHVWETVAGVKLETPFKRMSYKEAMEKYGSDKPDCRFEMLLSDVSDIVGRKMSAMLGKGLAQTPRKTLDAYTQLVKDNGGEGLFRIKVDEAGEYKNSLTKFFSPETVEAVCDKLGAVAGDMVFLADACEAMGALRLEVAKRENMIPENVFSFLWVTEFPLLEYSESEGRYVACHHPFTSPMDQDLELFETNPGVMRAKAYDMVVNGMELGGGSVRINRSDIQKRMFRALGFSDEVAYDRFGYLIDAFRYGAPPHGGIAFGFDRMAAVICNEPAIRDVIAFPKVKDASCPMTQAPSGVSDTQLSELGLTVKPMFTEN